MSRLIMESIELKNIDSEDIEDVLIKIEDSFGFKFEKTELKDVKTFGELSDIILNKLQFDNVNDCTSQQAFYKLSNAISLTLNIDKSTITTKTELNKIFPRPNRRKKIKQVEKELGFSIKILRPKHFIIGTLAIIFLLSLILLYFNWKIGVSALVFSIVGLRIATMFGKELDLKTVGEIADKMSRENYLKSRRNSSTINRSEIARKIQDLFSNELDIPVTALTREASF